MVKNNPPRNSSQKFDRRDFLKLFTSGAISSLIPTRWDSFDSDWTDWPYLDFNKLPAAIKEIIELVPNAVIGDDGYLALVDNDSGVHENVTLAPTNWNIENCKPYNQLEANVPWGIVIHWFGDKYPEQQNLEFYLHGFNGKRQIGEFYTSTSAHFLVGNNEPFSALVDGDLIGIVQTQKPGPEGIPYQAAHIRSLDHTAFDEGRHYFVSALNMLSTQFPGVRTILQDFYDQPGVLAHMKTIAIETTGYDFDNPEHYPIPQKIANEVAVVWAIMKRYSISAINIMGHLEIQLSKPDPGKKFLALIKFLIGIKALIDTDENMKKLVFGPFLQSAKNPKEAVVAYFDFNRDYMLLTTSPRQVNEWDAWSKFLYVYEIIRNGHITQYGTRAFFHPLMEPTWQPGYRFLVPDNHEGIDIYPDTLQIPRHTQEQAIYLLADGVCLYQGKCTGLHDGQLAIFRHRQQDGSEIISSYGHLDALANLKVGEKYTGGEIIGKISTPEKTFHGFLHFSLAYGPSWEIYLNKSPNIPLNAGSIWIKNFFFDPSNFLSREVITRGGLTKNPRFTPR